MIAIGLVVLLCACTVRNMRIDVDLVTSSLAPNLILIIASRWLRRRGWSRLSDALTAFAQMALLSAIFAALTYVLATTALPLQDDTLVAIDRALGLDWRAFVYGLIRWPLTMMTLNWAYASFSYQVLITPLLFVWGTRDRAVTFVLAWALALAFTTAIFPFAPALGGFLHFGIARTDVPEILVAASWVFADTFERARGGADLLLDVSDLEGLVTFPSFHAAVAVMIPWACWTMPRLRWPVLAWNSLMWVSAIPIGGHYAVDIVGGSIVSAGCIVVSRAIVRDNCRALASRSRPDPVGQPVLDRVVSRSSVA